MTVKACFKFLIFSLALLSSISSYETAYAQQKITPSHVYQVTEDVILQLERMHKANLSTPNLDSLELNIPNRLPRHVIQQAFNVRKTIQFFKKVNGMEFSEVTPPEVHEITPAEVLSVTKEILDSLVAFDETFKLTPFQPSASFVDGKTPTDVYKNLLRAQEMIIQLGIPPIVPNNVYDSAIALNHDLSLIRKALGDATSMTVDTESLGKTPVDAYNLAHYTLQNLKTLTEKPAFTIPKGVIMPEKLKKASPREVQQVLLYALAEVSSIKAKLGIMEVQLIPEPSVGQTPSSVYDQLSLANRQIQSML